VKPVPLLLLSCALAACSHRERGPIDPELASRLPSSAQVVAGLDVDRLRGTPLFAKLPDSLREASTVLAAYDPPNLVTVSRVRDRIVVHGPAAKGPPPDLLRYASDAPIWVVARGSTDLPLIGNLSNLNRMLRQTDFTRVTAQVADRVEYRAEGVCGTAEQAQHLESNIRAIATLAQLTLDVRRDHLTVHVNGSTTVEAIGRLF
jgi:hypothetical protein